MSKPIYEETRLLCESDVDFRGRWRLGMIFLAMQDLGAKHADDLGAGFFDLRKENLAWVLTRAQLVMDRYPLCGETLRLETWPGQMRHGVFPRYYLFRNADTLEEVGRASTLWMLMDLKNRQLASVQHLSSRIWREGTPSPCLGLPGGLALPTAEALKRVHEPAYSDLDQNGHVNNTRYIDWFTDLIPVSEHARGGFSSVLIHYARQCYPGEQIELSLTREEDKVFFFGEAGGETRFGVNAVWKWEEK